MAVANPSDLTVLNNYIGWAERKCFVVASLTAVTTYFNNTSTGVRQICVKPFFHSWPRFTAVLGAVMEADKLHFQSWKNGITFGTGIGSSRGPRVYHRKGKCNAPIDGAILPAGEASTFFASLGATADENF